MTLLLQAWTPKVTLKDYKWSWWINVERIQYVEQMTIEIHHGRSKKNRVDGKKRIPSDFQFLKKHKKQRVPHGRSISDRPVGDGNQRKSTILQEVRDPRVRRRHYGCSNARWFVYVSVLFSIVNLWALKKQQNHQAWVESGIWNYKIPDLCEEQVIEYDGSDREMLHNLNKAERLEIFTHFKMRKIKDRFQIIEIYTEISCVIGNYPLQ